MLVRYTSKWRKTLVFCTSRHIREVILRINASVMTRCNSKKACRNKYLNLKLSATGRQEKSIVAISKIRALVTGYSRIYFNKNFTLFHYTLLLVPWRFILWCHNTSFCDTTMFILWKKSLLWQGSTTTNLVKKFQLYFIFDINQNIMD